MKAWIYIIIAVVLQTMWGVVLKVLNFPKIWNLIQSGQWLEPGFILQILPLIAYLLLGLVIAIVISKAYKLLPMSMVYAFWMGLTLILQVLVDVLYYDEKMKWSQYLCIVFILIGILGIKLSNPSTIQPVEVEIDGLD